MSYIEWILDGERCGVQIIHNDWNRSLLCAPLVLLMIHFYFRTICLRSFARSRWEEEELTNRSWQARAFSFTAKTTRVSSVFGALPFGHIVLHWSEGMCCIASFFLMPSISFFMAVSISCLEHSERDLLLVCSHQNPINEQPIIKLLIEEEANIKRTKSAKRMAPLNMRRTKAHSIYSHMKRESKKYWQTNKLACSKQRSSETSCKHSERKIRTLKEKAMVSLLTAFGDKTPVNLDTFVYTYW